MINTPTVKILGAAISSALLFSVLNNELRKYAKDKKVDCQLPLLDVGHEIIPEFFKFKDYTYINDVLNGLIFLGALIILKSRERLKLLFIWSILIFVKTITMWMTVLPQPHTNCEYKESLDPRDACHDMSISGHTITALISLLFINDQIPLPWYVWVSYGVLEINKLGARCHYTLDIFVAILLALLAKDSKTLENVFNNII